MSFMVKLIFSISSFVLVFCMLFFGVFTSQNILLNIEGNVSFTPEGFSVTVLNNSGNDYYVQVYNEAILVSSQNQYSFEFTEENLTISAGQTPASYELTPIVDVTEEYIPSGFVEPGSVYYSVNDLLVWMTSGEGATFHLIEDCTISIEGGGPVVIPPEILPVG